MQFKVSVLQHTHHILSAHWPYTAGVTTLGSEDTKCLHHHQVLLLCRAAQDRELLAGQDWFLFPPLPSLPGLPINGTEKSQFAKIDGRLRRTLDKNTAARPCPRFPASTARRGGRWAIPAGDCQASSSWPQMFLPSKSPLSSHSHC